MQSKINLQNDVVQVDVIMYKDGKYYVAFIPALNLTSHSTKEKTAIDDLDDAVKMFFEYWTDSGRLDEKLLALGWKPQKTPKAIKKSKMVPSNENITVPYSLLDKTISRKSMNLPVYS